MKLRLVTLSCLLALLLLPACAAAQTPAPPPTQPPTNTPPAPTATAAATTVPSPTPEPTPAAPGETRLDAYGIEQVWVPAGEFLMGAGDAHVQELLALPDLPAFVKRALASEQPQHKVTLTQGYWIDRYEVTNAAFQAFIAAGGYQTQEYWSEAGWEWLGNHAKREVCNDAKAKEAADLPCVKLSWFEAEAYAAWRGGRLPSEAEWEYAARGPQSLIYPWGNTFDPALANILNSPGLKPVGSYPEGASWVGALDMAGNAMEWVNDWLDVEYYAQNIAIDPPGPASGGIKIEKGGWWGSNPYVARASYRHFEDPPTYSDGHIGFRIVTPVR